MANRSNDTFFNTLSLITIAISFVILIWNGNQIVSMYKETRKHEPEPKEVERQANIEKYCDLVEVSGGNWLGVERRAKPGVTREVGLKVCGQNAFNTGGEISVASTQSFALGSGSRAVPASDWR